MYIIIYMTLYIAIRILYDEYKTYGLDSVEIEQQTIDYIKSNFSFDEIYFFSEVGFGDEGGNTECIKKFERDTITFRVLGNPTSSQLVFLKKIVDTLNCVIASNKIVMVGNGETDANLTIFFIPKSQMKEHQHRLINGIPSGRFYTIGINKGTLNKIEIFIACDEINDKDIKAAIMQEFTQSLGIFNDSERLQNTIFRDGYGLDSAYGPLDLACVKILYNSGLKPGVRLSTFEEAMGIDYEEIARQQNLKKERKLFEID